MNGTIQAVATAYQEPEDPVRFTALTSEKAFRDGANEIRMFLVGGTPAKPELRELTVSYSG